MSAEVTDGYIIKYAVGRVKELMFYFRSIEKHGGFTQVSVTM